jgi:5-(carboxyamino)imidazole ribonucleotide synthase
VELFEVDRSAEAPDGLLVNELAMRPHNSGHWSMDGSVTGQFEQHLRAVLDYPLGRTDAIAPYTVMGNVLGGPDTGPGSDIGIDERVHHLAARFPQVKVHLYGKAFRPGRKLGHVNVLGADLPELRRIAELAATWLGTGRWGDGYDIHGGDDGNNNDNGDNDTGDGQDRRGDHDHDHGQVSGRQDDVATGAR